MPGIYVHIPYCRARCGYCDFASSAALESMDAYLEALLVEASFYRDKIKRPSTLYIGGGTPSVLGPDRFTRLIEGMSEFFDLTRLEEFTVEVNPESASEAFLKALIASGVNRLSIGLQTLEGDLLKRIGRLHDAETFLEVYHRARRLGFENISLDLMIGLPGQTIAHLDRTLDAVIRLKPEHLSVYSLKVEPGTPFDRQGVVEDEERDRQMDQRVEDRLSSAGYDRYELSNYALPGRESKHNTGYWRLEPYLGLGLAAHGDLGTERYANTSDLSRYIKELTIHQTTPVVERDKIGRKERLFEAMILGLRMREGVDLQEMKHRYGIDPEAGRRREIDRLIAEGLLLREGSRLRLTPKGRDLSNRVFVEFL
jgi:oxygen-independent coproporphyrinogen-3 oxidase